MPEHLILSAFIDVPDRNAWRVDELAQPFTDRPEQAVGVFAASDHMADLVGTTGGSG